MNRNTLDASAVEAMRSSPTSIVEIDESLVPMTSPTNTRQIRADNEISPKLDMSDYRPSFRISCSPRTFRTLPTVEEVPGSAKQRARPIDSPSPSPAATDVSIDKNEVRKLNQSASFYALRGNEQMALKMYKKALSLATKEVSRIQRKMEKAMGEPDYLQKTIQQLLNDEWVEVALIIAEIKTMMAIIYERTGIYDRAIKCCNEARDVYERQMKRNAHQPEEEIFQQAQESATQMKHMAEKLLEADGSFHLRKGLHESCIKIHRELCRSKDPAVREMLFDTIYDNLSAVLALELQSLGKNHPEVAETLTFLSKLHLARNDKYKALISMERAVSVAEIALGNLHPRTAEKYYDLARQYETANRDRYDHENAVVFYEKAIEAYKEADGDFTRLVGTISNDIGVLLLRNGYHDSAIQRLSDALAFYGSSEDSQEVISADTAQVWRNLAECCVLRGEWESAVNNFTSALNVQRSARTLFDTVSPNNPGIAMPPLIHDESIADTLLCLGRAHSGNKNNKKAYQTFLEALTMLQNIPEVSSERNSNNDSPLGLAEKQDQVANAIFCLAQVQEAEMKLDEALKLYEEALELRTFSDTLRPKGKEANLIHCALCRAGIGSVRLHKNQYDLAFKAFNIALQNAQQHGLTEKHPVVEMLWEKLKVASKRIATDSESSEKCVEEGIEVSDKGENPLESRDDSEATSHKREKGSSQFGAWFLTASRLEKKACQKKKKGDIAGAIEATKHVLEFRRAYVAKQQDGKKGASKAKQQLAKTIVSLAQLLLLREERKEAEKQFREAIDLYKSSGLKKDSDPVQEIQRELDRLKWQNKAAAAGNKR